MKAQHHQRYEGTLEFVDLGSGDWILRLGTGDRYRLELPATLWNALAGRAAQRICVEANPSDTWTSTMSGLPTLLVHRIIQQGG